MTKKMDVIRKKIECEREKLNTMPLGSSFTLKQSQEVDNLINEYYHALAKGRNAAV